VLKQRWVEVVRQLVVIPSLVLIVQKPDSAICAYSPTPKEEVRYVKVENRCRGKDIRGKDNTPFIDDVDEV